MVDLISFRRELTPSQVDKVVRSLGSAPPIAESGGYAYQTICHNEAGCGKHKLLYYPSSALFHCFTECGETFDIFDLVIKAKYIQDGDIITIFNALEYIEQLLDIEAPEQMSEEKETTNDILKYLDRVSNEISLEERPLKKFDEWHLQKFPKTPPLDWLDEHISMNSIVKYEIGYDPLSCAITIPVRDKEGDLIGIRCRRLEQPIYERIGRYGPLINAHGAYNYPISFTLYGIDKTIGAISESKKAIILESEKSVLQLDSYYGDKNFSVACQGSNISIRQIMILKRLGVTEVTIGFDRQFEELGTQEYETHMRKVIKHANKIKQYIENVYIITDEEKMTAYKDSPTDKGKEVFEELYRKRVKI